MRFLRFSYIIPRVVVIILLLLATEIGSGYLLRWGIISGGESTVGAKVDVGNVKASLLESRVLVRDLAVTNPRSPMKNLFEADRIEIDFDSYALLRKKLIADYGIVSGLEFSTPRQTSGELPASEQAADDTPSTSWAKPIAKQYAENWLSDLETRFTTDLQQQFQSVRLAQELSERWPRKYQQLETQARAIKADAKKLEQDVRVAKKNPLRHMEFLTQVPNRVTALRQKLQNLQAELATLPEKLAADRLAVAAARQHDEQLVREQLNLGEVDAKALTNYLLGEQITGPVNEAIGWVRWARTMVPPRGKVAAEPPSRGEDILFAGCEQLPNMLVKALRLEGSARMGGQPVELVGVVRDWTNQPELHTNPTTLEVTTKGGLPLTVQAKFDRTRTTPRDEVYCATNDLMLPELSLGKQGKLQLAVAPTRANVTLSMNLVGDQLTGNIEVIQQGIALTPTVAGGALGSRLQSALAASVSNIDQATTNVALSGKLDSPEFDFDSSLGTALASAINKAATDVIASERQRLLAKGQQQVDAQMAKVTSQFAAFESKLTSELQAPGEVLAGLLGQQSGETQIGKSPFGQFFK